MAVNYWWKPPDWKKTVEAEKRFKSQLLSEMKRGLEEKRRGDMERGGEGGRAGEGKEL
jgi:hypothetical protein